MLNKLRVL